MLIKKLSSFRSNRAYKYLSTLTLHNPEITSANNVIESKEMEILQSPDYFKVHNLFSVKTLFDANVHYGHKETSLNDKMKPFVFGSRLGHIIFDLDKTAIHLREALNFAAHIAFRDGIILFISRNPRMTILVEDTALACKEFAVAREWRLGTLTDSSNVHGFNIRLPDLCILLNTLEINGSAHMSVLECATMCIPTIGIVDSNCDPNLITFPVPGNDDSPSCYQLYCQLFKDAILRGKEERKKFLKKFVKEDESDEKTNEQIVS